jgi:hypothetical protein
MIDRRAHDSVFRRGRGRRREVGAQHRGLRAPGHGVSARPGSTRRRIAGPGAPPRSRWGVDPAEGAASVFWSAARPMRRKTLRRDAIALAGPWGTSPRPSGFRRGCPGPAPGSMVNRTIVVERAAGRIDEAGAVEVAVAELGDLWRRRSPGSGGTRDTTARCRPGPGHWRSARPPRRPRAASMLGRVANPLVVMSMRVGASVTAAVGAPHRLRVDCSARRTRRRHGRRSCVRGAEDPPARPDGGRLAAPGMQVPSDVPKSLRQRVLAG